MTVIPHLRALLFIAPAALCLALPGSSRAAQADQPPATVEESPTYLRMVGEPKRITSIEPDHEYHPCWSPDGTQIAFTYRTPDTSAATIAILDLASGDITKLDFGIVGDMHFGYAKDGDMLVFDARDEGGPPYICTYDFKTKKTMRITPEGSVSVGPTTSPDGRYAAYASHRGQGAGMEIWLYDCMTGKERQLTRNTTSGRGGCVWSADSKTVFFTAEDDHDHFYAIDLATAEQTRYERDTPRQHYTTCSPDNTLLVFNSWERGQFDIFVMPITGGAAQPLLATDFMEGHPDFSPDGTQIAYTSTRNGTHDLWIIDVEPVTPEPAPIGIWLTSEPKRLTTLEPSHEFHPCWSPDGSHIAFTYNMPNTAAATIAILDLASGDITPLDLGVVGDMHFGYARNGEMLIFDARDDGGPPYVCSYEFKTKKTTRLTPEGTVSVHPSTSPDGRYAVYASHRGGKGRDLWLFDCTTGTERQLTTGGPVEKSRCSWSADGKTVFYVSENANYNFYKVDVATGTQTRFTNDADRQSFATCSLDNAWLVYESWENNQHDIRAMPVAGGPVRPLITHPAMDGHPDFSPDGKRIVFASTRAGTFDLWVVEVEMTNPDTP